MDLLKKGKNGGDADKDANLAAVLNNMPKIPNFMGNFATKLDSVMKKAMENKAAGLNTKVGDGAAIGDVYANLNNQNINLVDGKRMTTQAVDDRTVNATDDDDVNVGLGNGSGGVEVKKESGDVVCNGVGCDAL